MKIGLIGSSGVLGSEVKRHISNAIDIHRNENRRTVLDAKYDLIFICAPKGLKWYANKHPKEDLSEVKSLITLISSLKAQKFILFSTIDAFESYKVNDLDITETDYGLNRKLLEDYILENNIGSVVRLGMLLGNFIKKNLLVDIKTQNLNFLKNSNSMFQFSNLFDFDKLIHKILKNDFNSYNYFSVPISINEIEKSLKVMFPELIFHIPEKPIITYQNSIFCQNKVLNNFNQKYNDKELCIRKIKIFMGL